MNAERERLTSCEAWDPREPRGWAPLPALAAPRSSAGVAALHGRLFAVGGSASDDVVHGSCEVRFSNDQGFGLRVWLRGRLFTLGGSVSAHIVHGSCEVRCLEANAPPCHARPHPSSVALHGRLFAVCAAWKPTHPPVMLALTPVWSRCMGACLRWGGSASGDAVHCACKVRCLEANALLDVGLGIVGCSLGA